MDQISRLTILGAGSVRCSPPVIASLATYFGERPLEIRLYDADEERLDLMDRLARHSFLLNEAPHLVLYRTDPIEALEGADRIVLQIGRNCARKYHGKPRSVGAETSDRLITEAIAAIMASAPPEADVLSLQRRSIAIPIDLYRRLDWPPQIPEDQLPAVPHQVLRWIRGEEMMHEVFKENERSPFKAWLNDPNTAELVINRAGEPGA